MCGNQGQWEYSAAYNESLADGCTETAMCDAPTQVSWIGRDWSIEMSMGLREISQ